MQCGTLWYSDSMVLQINGLPPFYNLIYNISHEGPLSEPEMNRRGPLSLSLSPLRHLIGGAVRVSRPPPWRLPACLTACWAYTGSGLTAGGGQHIISPNEYGGGPSGLLGSTAKNDNDLSSPQRPTCTHLKVVAERGRGSAVWGRGSTLSCLM